MSGTPITSPEKTPHPQSPPEPSTSAKKSVIRNLPLTESQEYIDKSQILLQNITEVRKKQVKKREEQADKYIKQRAINSNKVMESISGMLQQDKERRVREFQDLKTATESPAKPDP